jgi:hypothetical protein
LSSAPTDLGAVLFSAIVALIVHVIHRLIRSGRNNVEDRFHLFAVIGCGSQPGEQGQTGGQLDTASCSNAAAPPAHRYALPALVSHGSIERLLAPSVACI